MSSTPPIKVLLTGFGSFLDVKTNPSWEIARRLPTSIDGPHGKSIQLIVPTDPMPAAYDDIKRQVMALIDTHAPDLVVHMGLDVDAGPGAFKIERSAPRDGYHQYPDIRRRVFTRAENKNTFAKAPVSLSTTIDLGAAESVWQSGCASLTLAANTDQRGAKNANRPEKHKIHVQLSDDVGTYVCGFCYYVALLHLQALTGRRRAVFIHVPPLETDADLAVGVRVTQEVVRALVQVM